MAAGGDQHRDLAKHRLIVDAKVTSTQMQKTVEIRRIYDAGS